MVDTADNVVLYLTGGQTPLKNDSLSQLVNSEDPDLAAATREALREADEIMEYSRSQSLEKKVETADDVQLADTELIHPVDAVIDSIYAKIAQRIIDETLKLPDQRFVGKSRGEWDNLHISGMIDLPTLIAAMKVRGKIMNDAIEGTDYSLGMIYGLRETSQGGVYDLGQTFGFEVSIVDRSVRVNVEAMRQRGARQDEVDRAILNEEGKSQFIIAGTRTEVANGITHAIRAGANKRFSFALPQFRYPYHDPVDEMVYAAIQIQNEVISKIDFQQPQGRLYLSTAGREIDIDDILVGNELALHNLNPVLLNASPLERDHYEFVRNPRAPNDEVPNNGGLITSGRRIKDTREGVLNQAVRDNLEGRPLYIVSLGRNAGQFDRIIPDELKSRYIRVSTPNELNALPARLEALAKPA